MNKRLCLRDTQGHLYLPIEEIVRFEADDCYTIIHTLCGKKYVQTGTLVRFFERVKQIGLFYRIHKSHVVNLLFVLRVNNCGTITLMDGSILPITEDARKEIEGNMPAF